MAPLLGCEHTKGFLLRYSRSLLCHSRESGNPRSLAEYQALAPADSDVLRLRRSFIVGDGDGAFFSRLQVEVVVGEAGGLVGGFEVDEVGVCRNLEMYL